MNWHEWITQKYIVWRGNAIGNERSITEFAEMIGISQPLMSSYMKSGGSKPKTLDIIRKFEVVYGDEIYEILGIEKPQNTLSDTELDLIPSDLRDSYL